MNIAVAGATGVVGKHLTRILDHRRNRVLQLARSKGVDLTSGAGLASKLQGVDAVIDVTNITTQKKSASIAFFDTVTRNLLAAEAEAGVGHHVALSIVGIDRVDLGYYHGKLRQEELIKTGEVPSTIVRATQFHEFPGQTLKRTAFGPFVLAPKMKVQPIAVREVAEYLADSAAESPGVLAGDLAGPQVEQMTEMIARLLAARGSHKLQLRLKLPGAGGRAMAAGALCPTAPGPRGSQRFDQWLASDDAKEWLAAT